MWTKVIFLLLAVPFIFAQKIVSLKFVILHKQIFDKLFKNKINTLNLVSRLLKFNFFRMRKRSFAKLC